MARILPFLALADQPHDTSLLGCGNCGHLWVGVWLHVLKVSDLQCPKCFVVGRAIVDPVRESPEERYPCS